MTDYGEAVPCPNCGSGNVRWRRRRFYDVILTYARYLADVVVSTLFGMGQTRIAGGGSHSAGRANLQALAYSESRQFYESRMGTKTASRFWRCPDCRKKGQVFDRLRGAVKLGDSIVGSGGDVTGNVSGGPINRDNTGIT